MFIGRFKPSLFVHKNGEMQNHMKVLRCKNRISVAHSRVSKNKPGKVKIKYKAKGLEEPQNTCYHKEKVILKCIHLESHIHGMIFRYVFLLTFIFAGFPVIGQDFFSAYDYKKANKILKKGFLTLEIYDVPFSKNNLYYPFHSKRDGKKAIFKSIPMVFLTLDFIHYDTIGSFTQFYFPSYFRCIGFIYKKEELLSIIDVELKNDRGLIYQDYNQTGFPEFINGQYDKVFFDLILNELCVLRAGEIYYYNPVKKKEGTYKALVLQKYGSWYNYKKAVERYHEKPAKGNGKDVMIR
jgi:hypothetical protein